MFEEHEAPIHKLDNPLPRSFRRKLRAAGTVQEYLKDHDYVGLLLKHADFSPAETKEKVSYEWSASRTRPNIMSVAWKVLEKEVRNRFYDLIEEAGGAPEDAVIKRNLRGNDFGLKDSDVDILRVPIFDPGFIIDCKQKTTQDLVILKLWKEERERFKKHLGWAKQIQVMTLWAEHTKGISTPYQVVDLKDFLVFWRLWKTSKAKSWCTNIWSTHVRFKRGEKYLDKVISKIQKEYVPMKMAQYQLEQTPIPMLCQRVPRTSTILCVFPL